MLRNYTEFITELQKAGFSGAVGGKDDGVFGLFRYGWASMMYCTTEQFWGDKVFDRIAKINSEEATATITEQIYKYNPNANEKRIRRFIYGRA
jgi:hypothetical protein